MKTCEVGDWVRFYRGGVMVIGLISYVRRDTSGYWSYQTDQGEVREDSVLEVRRAVA